MKLQTFLLSLADERGMLPCLNKQIFGMECPGCGIQRAFWMLLEGDLGGAFLMYPAIYPLIVLAAFLIANRLFTIRYANTISITLMILTVVTILTNYILKFI